MRWPWNSPFLRRVSRVSALIVMVALGWVGIGGVRAQEEVSLQARIEEVEKIDTELAQATRELKSAKGPAERKKLRERIQELQGKLEGSLGELEKIAGPLPAAVRPEPTIPLEREIQSRERRHESVLESDVERRLPSQ